MVVIVVGSITSTVVLGIIGFVVDEAEEEEEEDGTDALWIGATVRLSTTGTLRRTELLRKELLVLSVACTIVVVVVVVVVVVGAGCIVIGGK